MKIYLETEKEIAVKDLPSAVSSSITKKFPGSTIKEAAIITDANGIKTYEAEVKGMDQVFDEQGNFIKSDKD